MELTVTFIGNDLDHALPVLTTSHAVKRLRHRGFDAALGLSTWSAHSIAKGATTLTVTSLPGRHAPGWTRRLLPPVMGSMLEFGSDDGSPPRRVYVSGDTLLIDELHELPVRFEAIEWGSCTSVEPASLPADAFRSGSWSRWTALRALARSGPWVCRS